MSKANQQIIESFDKKFTQSPEFPNVFRNLYLADEVVEFLEQALSSQESALKAQWRKEIDWLGKEQIELYKGKLPFTVFQGKATEEEKIAIYRQGLKDAVGILKKLREV